MAEKIVADVVYVYSPTKFYCRRQEIKCDFLQKQHDMRYYYQRHFRELGWIDKPVAEITPQLRRIQEEGSWVVVFFESGFKRAQILPESWDNLEDFSIVVYLIDIGRTVRVPKQRVFQLTSEFQQLEKVVFRCHLHDVCASAELPFDWPAEATELFERTLMAKLQVEILRRAADCVMDDGETSMAVEVCFEENVHEHAFLPVRSVKRAISQVLLKNQLAVCRSQVDTEDMGNPFEECDESDGNGVSGGSKQTYDTNPAATISSAYVDADDANINRVTWGPPILPKDSVLSCRATHVSERGQIYLQLCDNRGQLRSMGRWFEETYGRPSDNIDQAAANIDIKVGDDVVVFFEAEGVWERARVYSTTPAIDVILVDYGMKRRIQDRSTIRVAEHFGEIPMMAFRAVLDNVVPRRETEGWSEACLDWMHDRLHFKENNKVRRILKVTRVGTLNKLMPMRVTIGLWSETKLQWDDLGDALVSTAWGKRGTVKMTRKITDAYSEEACHIEARLDEEGSNQESLSIENVSFPDADRKVFPENELISTLEVGQEYNVRSIDIASSRNVFVVVEELNPDGLVHEQYQEELKNLCSAPDLTVGCSVGVLHEDTVYRGLVLKQEDEDGFFVRLVDSGRTVLVSRSHLKLLPPHLAELPLGAIMISVSTSHSDEGLHDFVQKARSLQLDSQLKMVPSSINLDPTSITASIVAETAEGDLLEFD